MSDAKTDRWGLTMSDWAEIANNRTRMAAHFRTLVESAPICAASWLALLRMRRTFVSNVRRGALTLGRR